MAAVDPFEGFAKTPLSSGVDGFVITPSDTVDLDIVPTVLWANADGIVRVTLKDMDDDTYVDLAVNIGPNPIRPKRVWNAGTTATGITGVI